LVTGSVVGRTGPSDVTIADLTGVAVEDIVVAEMALQGLAGL
jgi:ornithine cyclodeaminase/alanine dehydrogenase-like protein (mu-crystallin family)